MLSFDHLCALFFESLTITNHAPGTIQGYRCAIRKFWTFVQSIGIEKIEEITRETVRDYQVYLAEGKNEKGKLYRVTAQNNLLKGVIYLFRYICDNDYLVKDPTRGIKFAREPKTLPRNILSQVEVKNILEQPDIHLPIGYRNRAILELLYSTGIRASELRFIDLNDINRHDSVLLIRQGKGKKDRYVPIGRSAHQFIEGYVDHIRPGLLKGKANDALFITKDGNRIGNTALDKLIRKYARLAGIKKVVSCHTWRHTCATHLVNNGMDIRHVQALLGHSSLDSTQIYTRVAIKDLKRVIKKHHPREKQIRDQIRDQARDLTVPGI